LKKMLKIKASASISVSALRGDRSLRLDVRGTISADLRGELNPDLRGELNPGLWGELNPDLWGNVTGLRGELNPGLFGNIDECEISDDERANGVDVASLVEDES